MTTVKERYNRSFVLQSKPWSEYQLAIFDAVKNSDRHILVEAVAGAGKTTSIEGIVASCPTSWKVKVLAFNVHIVEELKARLPKSITVTTVHKMGLTLLTRYFGGIVVQPNDKKYQDLCQMGIEKVILPQFQLDKHQIRGARRYLEKVVHYAQVSMIPLQHLSPEEMCSSLLGVANRYGVSVNEEGADLDEELLLPLVPRILARGEKEARESQNIGLDDLLWLPNQWNLKATHCDLLLVDEAQDANAAMIALYHRIVGDGRIVIIGDPNQAIYGFSGSDAQSWQKLKQTFQPLELPLSVCYRCPVSHIRLAQELVPQIRSTENAIFGSIGVISPAQVRRFAEPNDLILCRFTAPLVKLCLKLISSGKKAKVRGRDIGDGITALAKKASGQSSFRQFPQLLQTYCKRQIDSYISNDLHNAAEMLEDKQLALEACYEEFDAENLTDFCDRIQSLFADDINGMTTLSTIHRAKGDQADRVFLLGSDSLPFTKKAKQKWQRQQEYNLQYVALTRAKQSLYLVPLPKKQEMLADLLNDPLGGMTFEERLPQYIERVIPVVWHNPELLPEFYMEYIPQVGDKVTKRGLYGWTGEAIALQGEQCLVNWGHSTTWEDAHNLISVVGRKLCSSNKEVRNDN
jgi:hypothetical protein